jgi:hypothetical protein
MGEPSPSPSFERAFAQRARGVRRRLVMRDAALGAAFGAAMGGALAGLAWWLRFGAARAPVFGAAVICGAVLGAFVARRRRWSNADVALYLDAKLGSGEVITTAVEQGDSPVRANIRERASLVLAEAKSERLAPRVLTRWHGLLPLGGAAALWLSVIPLPPPPAPASLPPGAEHVKKQDLAGLERIEALAELGGANPAQEERLKRLAAEAKKLREDVARGVEKRDALARIAKLRDDIAAEQLHFGDGENRAGLDAAVNELMQKELTQKAARALGDGDLTAFDAEMQRLATLAEKRDRDLAKHTLDDAAKAAREKGAKGLAEALERQKAAMERAESKLDALKELANRLGNGLDQDGRDALKELDRSGSPEAQKKLADALDRALKKLSEEERKQLAENLKRELEHGGGAGRAPMTKEELEELARRLDAKGSDRTLEEQLRELARREPSEDSRRERSLGDADRGGAEAQRGLGAAPMPTDGSGPGKPSGPQQERAEPDAPGPRGSQGKNGSEGKNGSDKGGTGSRHDEGTGTHDGKTSPLDVKELRSKADGQLLPGAPMRAATLGRAPARAGETANQLGTGTLGQVGPSEVGAVEGADIPEEYREQVGRYFEP